MNKVFQIRKLSKPEIFIMFMRLFLAESRKIALDPYIY